MTNDRLLPDRPDRPTLASVPLFTAFGADSPLTGRPGRVRSDFALARPPLHAVTADEPPAVPPRIEVTAAGTDGDAVDWDEAASLRNVASKRLTVRLEAAPGAGDHKRRELGRTVILEVVQEATDARFAVLGSTWSVGEQQALARAVFDLMFGLGRLQPLVDREDVEDIIGVGHDRVFLNLVDGRKVPAPK